MVVLKVLLKTLTISFYKNNIGSFLVVFYIAFMLMRGQDHIELAKSISNSLSLTLLTLALWGVYWLKIYAFIIKIVDKAPNHFLRQLSLCRFQKQFKWLFVVLFLMGAPAWAYAKFIAGFNIEFNTYGLMSIMIGFLFISNSVLTYLLIKKLQQPIKEAKIGLWHRFISEHITLPQPFWYIRHLFVKEPMLAFLSKTGALLLLSGSFYLFKTDVYDWRLLGVGTLFSFLLNSMLIYNLYEFTIANYWINNLPRSGSTIIVSTLIALIILFIPEVVFIAFHFSDSIQFTDWLGLLFLGIALGCFLFTSLFFKPILKEAFGKRVFYLMVLMIFLILYSIPLIVISTLFFAFSFWVLANYYRLLSTKL